MKKLIILLTGLAIFLINFAFGNECVQPHTTHNVGHQFYEALIETPKDAIVKGAVATKELGKDVAAAVAISSAAHDLKDAAKELVIEAPVKTAYAIKNGTIKMFDGTKKGIKIAYNTVVKKPAHKIKDAAERVANSDFVQGTKETLVELGQQFSELGHDIADATKSGAHKAYHVAIEKPVGAVKAAAQYWAHADEANTLECAQCQTCVMILPAPLLTARSLEYLGRTHNSQNITIPNITTIAVMPLSWVDGSVEIVTEENVHTHEEIGVEFLMDVPCQIEEEYALSQDTINKLANAYQAVQNDLSQ